MQIETFDPHEPFFSDPSFEALYSHAGESSPDYDWSEYMQVIEDDQITARVRVHYAALVTMCDASLGRVLDAMDEHDLWADTMLIICTDHGFLLGERGWWGKSVPPWFEETVHTPLFVWNPRRPDGRARHNRLVQTVNLGPTLLEFFGVPLTTDMHGVPIGAAIRGDVPTRQTALFGAFGGHVSITDGRYVYMRASMNESNEPLVEHTLMPTHMRGFFTADELAGAELHEPLPFTKGMPVLTVAGRTATSPFAFGTRLYDLDTDPQQETPLVDHEFELRLATLLRDGLHTAQAPTNQFERLGMPQDGALDDRHLLCAAQHEAAVSSSRVAPSIGVRPGLVRDRRGSSRVAPSIDEFPALRLSVRTLVGDLMARPDAAEILRRHCTPFVTGPFAPICESMSLYRAAALMIGVLPWATLALVARELAALPPDPHIA